MADYSYTGVGEDSGEDSSTGGKEGCTGLTFPTIFYLVFLGDTLELNYHKSTTLQEKGGLRQPL